MNKIIKKCKILKRQNTQKDPEERRKVCVNCLLRSGAKCGIMYSEKERKTKNQTSSRKDKKMKYTIETDFGNRKDYYPVESYWAANLIAEKFSRGVGVKKVSIIDNEAQKVKLIVIC